MRSVVVVLLLAACGSPPRAKSAPEPQPVNAQPAKPGAQSVDDVALRFARAAAAGDTATARSLALTYDEIVDITTTAPSRESFDAALDDVLKQMAQKSEQGASIAVTGVKVIETRELGPPKDSKLKRAVSAAVVEFELSRDGQPAKTHGWLFLKTAAGWKFSPKK